jgi:hypothetical protein
VPTAAALGRADTGCDVAIGGFALFTLVANGAVLVGAGLDAMIAAAAATLSLGGILGWRARGKAMPAEASARSGVDPSGWTTRSGWQRALVAALAALVAAGYALGAPLALVWLAGALLSGVLVAVECIGAPDPPERNPAADPRATAVLAAMSLVCVAIVLVAHRPDFDDSFYLNLAVNATDHPAEPLLAYDTLHGVPGVEMSLPVYRVHSIELLVATLSRLTGRPVLDIAHLWIPAIAALLVPLAYARLFRLLLPDRWLWAVGTTLAYLLYASDAVHHGWPNFGLVRLHQGKGILLSLMLPLLAAYAIEFGREPSRRRWLRLAGAQVAALGLSASALWLAPLVAGLALIAGIPTGNGARLRFRTLAAGMAASGYVVAVALALRGATATAISDLAFAIPETRFDSGELAMQAIRSSMGTGPMAAFTIFCALAAWSFCNSARARRYCACFAFGWLLIWNPFLASWIAAHLTGAPAYWRSFWLLPIPVLVAVVLSAPLALGGAARPWLGRAAALALTSIVFLGAVRTPTLSSANHVRIGWPGWKVPRAAFEAARVAALRAGPGASVLAPESVALWIPALHDHPYPLVVRLFYLPILNGHLTNKDLSVRVALMRLVSGDARPPHADELLRDAIAEHAIRAVCLSSKAADWQDITGTLADSGLRKVYQNTDYQVWAVGPGA